MKPETFESYMACAEAFAKRSKAIRKKVGAVAVTPHDMMLYSYNGTAAGEDNTCEYTDETGQLVTKREVLHAEANIISKAAREGFNLNGSTVFVTLAPCIECAKLLRQAGVVRVVYKEPYRDMSGVEYLSKRGVEVIEYLHDNSLLLNPLDEHVPTISGGGSQMNKHYRWVTIYWGVDKTVGKMAPYIRFTPDFMPLEDEGFPHGIAMEGFYESREEAERVCEILEKFFDKTYDYIAEEVKNEDGEERWQ